MAFRPSSSRRARPDSVLAKKENKLGLRASATGRSDLRELAAFPIRNSSVSATKASSIRSRLLDGGPHLHRRALSIGMAQGRVRRGAAVLQTSQTVRAVRSASFQAIPGNKARRYGGGYRRGRRPASTIARPWMLDRGPGASRANRPWPSSSPAKPRCVSPTRRCRIHGGYGFIKDYPVEKFYRDVKLCTIGEGTSENTAAGGSRRQLLKSG